MHTKHVIFKLKSSKILITFLKRGIVSGKLCVHLDCISHKVDDVSNVLNQLEAVDDIKAQALQVFINVATIIHCYYNYVPSYWQANDTFYGIPCEIRDQISNQTRGNIIRYYRFTILYCFISFKTSKIKQMIFDGKFLTSPLILKEK